MPQQTPGGHRWQKIGISGLFECQQAIFVERLDFLTRLEVLSDFSDQTLEGHSEVVSMESRDGKVSSLRFRIKSSVDFW